MSLTIRVGGGAESAYWLTPLLHKGGKSCQQQLNLQAWGECNGDGVSWFPTAEKIVAGEKKGLSSSKPEEIQNRKRNAMIAGSGKRGGGKRSSYNWGNHGKAEGIDREKKKTGETTRIKKRRTNDRSGERREDSCRQREERPNGGRAQILCRWVRTTTRSNKESNREDGRASPDGVGHSLNGKENEVRLHVVGGVRWLPGGISSWGDEEGKKLRVGGAGSNDKDTVGNEVDCQWAVTGGRKEIDVTYGTSCQKALDTMSHSGLGRQLCGSDVWEVTYMRGTKRMRGCFRQQRWSDKNYQLDSENSTKFRASRTDITGGNKPRKGGEAFDWGRPELDTICRSQRSKKVNPREVEGQR